MSDDIQLFPHHVEERGSWSEDELTDTLQSASAHVRYLLRELSESPRVHAGELKSKRVAYAITQRICNSAGKDSLVLVEEEAGEKVYMLNPQYRERIKPLVENAAEPPPTPATPKRTRRRNLGMGRMRKGMSATDGIADPSGMFPVRRVTQSAGNRALNFPEDVSLEFCQELMGFLNATSSGTRYRIVLDASGPRLELA